MESATVVAIDNDVRILNYMQAILADYGHEMVVFESGKAAMESMHAGLRPRVVLASNDLTDIGSPQLIRDIRQLNPYANIVVVSYLDHQQKLVDAALAGASDVLPKPFLSQQLVDLVDRLSAPPTSGAPPTVVELRVGDQFSLVFASPKMRELERQASLIARVNLPVLVLGESGTGKDIIARHIHNLSPRSSNKFLKVNCAAVPSELLESELFGYEAGAFTGATGSKPGKFKLSHQGTMFLDEIGEMHSALQAKLLQVLQDGTYSPLGSRAAEKVDVRVIAATNIDMKKAIAERRFREDLYYRLNGFCIQLPPLRERPEDIPVLLDYFVQRNARELGLSKKAPRPSSRLLAACQHYHWPGNARELESFVKRYLVLGDEQLMIRELSVCEPEPPAPRDIAREAILNALESVGGNRKEAARKLGISYKVLLRRIRDFGM